MNRLILPVSALLTFLLITVSGCGSGTLAAPPVVSLAISPYTVVLSAGTTQQFTAIVNGTSQTAVTWSVVGCAGTACGTISTSGLYTAPSLIPSAATVTVVATLQSDDTKSAKATVNHVPLQINIPETVLYLGGGETHQFTATVTGHPNTAVTWSLSGCTGAACGTITPTGLYTAPSRISSEAMITVVATSQADPTKFDTVTVHHMCPTVSISPPIGVLAPGATQNFAATVQYDINNAGVIWALGPACSGGSCGTLTNITHTSVTYTAPQTMPDPPMVTLTATSITDASKSAGVTITVSASPFVLSGKYAFLINGYRQGTIEAIAGQFNADGKGNLTGVWDANRGAAVEVGQPITGNYATMPDGHGTMTIQAGPATSTYIITVEANGATGRFAESTIPPNATSGGSSGYMVRQDEKYFTLSSLEGDRVIATYGEATGSHVAALGQFTSNAGGTLSGNIDLSWEIHQNVGRFPNQLFLTGSFGAPDASTGRGTASLQIGSPAAGTVTYNFAYYIVSNERVLLAQTDVGGFNSGSLIPTLSGEVRYQKNAGSFANISLNAPAVFHLRNAAGSVFAMFFDASMRVGQMVPNGSGSLSLTYDENTGGTISVNVTTTSTYSVSGNGRVTWSAPENAVAYLVDQNTGYFMSQDPDGAGFGAFEPQSGAFSIGSLAGTFLLNTEPPAMPQLENDVGWMTLANDGTATATLYINTGSGASQFNFTGNATIASNGRGTLVLNTTPTSVPQDVVFWAISPTRAVAILTVNPVTVNEGDLLPVLLDLQRTE